MPTYAELLESVHGLPVVEARQEALAEAESVLTGLRLSLRGRSDIWLPRGEKPLWLKTAAEQVERTLPGRGPALVCDLLSREPTLYELERTAPVRAVSAVRSYRDGATGELHLAIGTLTVRQRKRTVEGESAELEIELLPLADAKVSIARLERLALSISKAELSRHVGLRAAVAVGGAKEVPARGWGRELDAALWPYGYRLVATLEEPWRHEKDVNRRLSARKADLYIFMRRWSVDGRNVDHTDRMRGMVGDREAIDTGAAHTLDQALQVVRDSLRQSLQEVPAWPVAPPPPSSAVAGAPGALPPARRVASVPGELVAPRSWPQFRERLDMLESPTLTITERARDGVLHCPHPDPARLWVPTVALCTLSSAWVEADCSVGMRFAEWAKLHFGLNVAMFDSKIVAAGLDKFVHDGRELSREPHVQVDQAKSFTEVGRIHFALDVEGRKVVIDHIGLKLLGREAAT